MRFCVVFFVVPNEAPVILEAESTSSTSIDLKWSEATELHSEPLRGYVVVYKEINRKFQADIMKSVAPTPREAVLEDLKKFTKYTIRVYAFTSSGNGVPSEATSLRTQEDGKLVALSTNSAHINALYASTESAEKNNNSQLINVIFPLFLSAGLS